MNYCPECGDKMQHEIGCFNCRTNIGIFKGNIGVSQYFLECYEL